ncbi:tannase/feruloyl esterase family alpha/beta hydrolase [Paraburkholderia sp. J8-2]|uniref:tannase/feruloyl esterase family alpha/beta hydrolase n=1 Tax=Paraburkholderia sp. J8-2 TaxID=2805440 RepID=UPI0039EFC987
MTTHGTVDQTVSTRATGIYYQCLLIRMGFESFVRFYGIAGLQHAVGTEFNASWDSLTTLQNLVEHGTAPVRRLVTDTAGVPGRTRPLSRARLYRWVINCSFQYKAYSRIAFDGSAKAG